MGFFGVAVLFFLTSNWWPGGRRHWKNGAAREANSRSFFFVFF